MSPGALPRSNAFLVTTAEQEMELTRVDFMRRDNSVKIHGFVEDEVFAMRTLLMIDTFISTNHITISLSGPVHTVSLSKGTTIRSCGELASLTTSTQTSTAIYATGCLKMLGYGHCT